MSELLDGLTDGRQRQFVVAVALGFVLLSVIGRLMSHRLPIEFRPAPGFVLTLGILLGPAAAWGAGIGQILTDVLTGTFCSYTGVEYFTQLLTVLSGYYLWGAFGIVSANGTQSTLGRRVIAEYTLVALTTALIIAAVTALGSALVARNPFWIAVTDSFAENLLSMLTIGILIIFVMRRAGEKVIKDLLQMQDGIAYQREMRQIHNGRWALALAIVWALSGYGISVVFQMLGQASPHGLVNNLGRGLTTILSIAGPDGLYFQLGSGSLFMTAYVFLLIRSRRKPDNV